MPFALISQVEFALMACCTEVGKLPSAYEAVITTGKTLESDHVTSKALFNVTTCQGIIVPGCHRRQDGSVAGSAPGSAHFLLQDGDGGVQM